MWTHASAADTVPRYDKCMQDLYGLLALKPVVSSIYNTYCLFPWLSSALGAPEQVSSEIR